MPGASESAAATAIAVLAVIAGALGDVHMVARIRRDTTVRMPVRFLGTSIR